MIGVETRNGFYETIVANSIHETHLTIEHQHGDWHSRIEHRSEKVVTPTIPRVLTISIDVLKASESKCDDSVQGKSIRVSQNYKESIGAIRPADRVYTKVVRSMKVLSFGKASYFVALIDEYSGISLVRFTPHKSKSSNTVIEMVRLLESLFNSRIKKLAFTYGNTVKCVVSYGGDDYTGHGFENLLRQHGISHEITPAYSPESNGKAGRRNCTLMIMARIMLVSAELDRQDLWA